MNMDTHYVVMLKKGENWTEERTPELDALGVEHRNYQFFLQREGHAFAAGPAQFDGDRTLRGFTIMKADSLEAARELAEADPAVKSGHLRVDVFPWYTVAGRLSYNDLMIDM